MKQHLPQVSKAIPKLWMILSLVLLVGLSVAGSSEGKPRADTTLNKALDGSWEVNGRADNFQEYCDANFFGTLCAEWCEGLDLRPTGTLCCIEDGYLGFPGLRSDCRHFVR